MTALADFLRMFGGYLAAGWGLFCAVTFLVYAWDKFCSKHQKRRVRERTLLILAAVGGAPGALLAMELCRHKTRHRAFTVTVPVCTVLWVLVAAFCVGLALWG